MNKITLIFFISIAFFGSAQDKVSLDWVNTGSNMTIAILEVPEDIISLGDTIAVFYNNDNIIKCGGYVIWDNNRVALSVWGNDSTSDEKDGFYFNEEIKFYHIKNGFRNNLNAKFMTGNNLFTNNGISVIEKLY